MQELRLNYFSIWGNTFRIFRARFWRLLWLTLIVASPFFLINGMAAAHHMMTLGGAAMTGSEIPIEQMRMLWGSLVATESLVFIALTTAGWLMLAMLRDKDGPPAGTRLLAELGRFFCSIGFWIFAALQIIIFAMINTPDGRFKISGMVLLACSMLMIWSARDRTAPSFGHRLKRISFTGWLVILFVLLSFPFLYILLNGYVNHFLLMFMDAAGQKVMHLFPDSSYALPFGVIMTSRFLSQWLNLLPLILLLSTYLAVRELPPKAR